MLNELVQPGRGTAGQWLAGGFSWGDVIQGMIPRFDLPYGSRSADRRACVLVVEDEMLIRLMVSEALRDTGYDVVEACDADEALAVLNTSAQIDLVFSDVRMPGSLDGMGLLRAVKADFPDLPFIIVSADFDPAQALAAGATRALTKPYQFQAVIGIVGDALAQGA